MHHRTTLNRNIVVRRKMINFVSENRKSGNTELYFKAILIKSLGNKAVVCYRQTTALSVTDSNYVGIGRRTIYCVVLRTVL